MIFDSLDMKNIRLIFFNIFIDFWFSVFAEGIIVIDQLRNEIKNGLVLVFVGGVEGCLVGSCWLFSGDVAGLFDVTDIEEYSSISERFLVFFFWVRNSDFVDLNWSSKNRFNDSFDLFFEIFIIEVFGLILLNLFFFKTCSFKFEHHLGQILRNHSSGYSYFLFEDSSSV